MPAGWREKLARGRRAMSEHKVTTSVFGISLAAIVGLGIFAGVSSPGTAAASGSGAGSSTSSAQSLIGQRAPAFDLAALGNSTPADAAGHVSLAGYAGQPVIVNFFASWCGPCKTETPLLARYYKSGHGTVRVIGVDANDSRTAALAFTKKYGVSYPVGSDPAATTASAYGVAGLPQTFFLNAQHKIVDRVYGAVTTAALAKGVKLMGQPSAAGG
ncbi:MAG TPA: TlpA disulfide reductase family protein [Streptosporangiaceae bacterium]|jgi:cytochrome c biogenesis protein CcmG/thiol:disulfide interchange protein DsbE|nr:TlpA disulfide reductase family protein [Streptosporangiaceae bacterium]